ncbi:MAG: ABC transporter permease [Calditrichia bacterium]|nr:ABC transporter permease [Calditrichia bacterium]
MKLFFFLKEGFIGLRRARLSAAIAIISLFLALTLIGIFVLTGLNIKDVIFQFYRQIEIEAFLQPDLSTQKLNRLKQEIQRYPQIGEIIYVSREEALEEFQQIFGEDLQNVLSENPLPASFRIILGSDYSNPGAVEQLAKELNTLDGIQEIIYQKEIIRFLHKYLRLGLVIIFIFAMVLLIIITILVFNTIRLTIHARRNIIQIMKLVGATNYFIKGPFIAEGLIQGVLGGLLSAAFLWGLGEIIRGAIFPELLMTHYIYITLIIMGMILGLIGSYVSVNKYLT